MSKTKHFKRDEAIGKIAENLVSRLMNGCGLETTPVSDVDRKYWDLRVDVPKEWLFKDNHFTIEIKHDVYQARSGNIAIETWNSRKNEPAGIKMTKADLWAHVLSDSIWIARTGDLRNFIDYVKPIRIIEAAGDGNAFIYLYSSDEILESIFHRVDKMTVSDLKNKVKELCSVKY